MRYTLEYLIPNKEEILKISFRNDDELAYRLNLLESKYGNHFPCKIYQIQDITDKFMKRRHLQKQIAILSNEIEKLDLE